jgi:hypothetical protein
MNSKSESSAVNSSTNVDRTAKLNYDIPPLIQRSMDAFRRDLPELLKTKKLAGQWVAYHGDQRIGLGSKKAPLYQQCLKRGLKIDEFIVMCVTPDLPDEIDPEELMDL